MRRGKRALCRPGELERRGWDSVELKRRRRGDPENVGIARRLRTETTIALEWIAQNLSTGAARVRCQSA